MKIKNIPMFNLGRCAGETGINTGAVSESFRAGCLSAACANAAWVAWSDGDKDQRELFQAMSIQESVGVEGLIHYFRGINSESWPLKVLQLHSAIRERTGVSFETHASSILGSYGGDLTRALETMSRNPDYNQNARDLAQALTMDKQALATLAAALTEVSING